MSEISHLIIFAKYSCLDYRLILSMLHPPSHIKSLAERMLYMYHCPASNILIPNPELQSRITAGLSVYSDVAFPLFYNAP